MFLRFCRLSNDHKYFQYDDFAEKVDDQSPSPDKLSNKVPIVDIKMFFTGTLLPRLHGYVASSKLADASFFAFSTSTGELNRGKGGIPLRSITKRRFLLVWLFTRRVRVDVGDLQDSLD